VGYHMPINDGILKIGGSPGFVIKLSMIGIYCIVIPTSLLMAFVFKLPAAVVFFFLNWDQLFNCIPVAWKVNRGQWIKNLTRD
jgi:Na+-driven multidrug efflux pump